MKKHLSPALTRALQLASILTMLLAYTFISYRQHQINPKDTTIPSWSQLAHGVSKMTEINPRSEERWVVVDSIASGERFFGGMILSLFFAFIIGIGMGRYPSIEAYLGPPMALLAKVPPTAALAVFFVMVGTGTEMYLAMIVFGVVPTLAQAIYLSVKDLPQQMLDKATTLGASEAELLWNVIVRQVFPKLIEATRLQIGPARVYLIAAEMVCAGEGFGYRIRIQFKKLDMDVVYPYLLLLAAFGFLIDFGLKRLQRSAAPWYQSEILR